MSARRGSPTCAARRTAGATCESSARAALVERPRADVGAPVLEQVVGHEDDRDGARHLGDLLLPADALLQRRKRQRPIVAEREHLAVEHRAVRQPRRGRGNLRKAVGDELFAARPEVHRAGPPDQLRADAVPFPLDQPLVARPERLDRLLERRRQEERIRARAIVVGVRVREQPAYHSAVGVHSPISRAAMVVAGSSAACASARTTSVCETPTRSSPVRIFSSMKRCERSSARHQRADARLLRRRLQTAQRQDALVHPLGQRQRPRGSDRDLIEHERGRLGAVADDRVALLEQPVSRPVAASVQSRIAADGTRRLSRRPVRKNTAHAASAGGAAGNTATIAATFALVEVVRSIAS